MNKKTFIIKAIVSVAFFMVLLSFVQGHELLELLDEIDWFYFSLSFLLIPVMLSTSCLKWMVLLQVKSRDIPFLALIRIYLVGYFFSNLLPSMVGGDVVRSFYAGKIINNQAYSAAAVFIERFTGIFFLILLVIFAPLMRPELYQSPYFYIPAAAAMVLLVVIFWVWTVKQPLALPDKIITCVFDWLQKLVDWVDFAPAQKGLAFLQRVYRAVLKRLQRFHEELQGAMQAIGRDRVLFCKVIALTVFFYILTWVNVYVSFRAFGISPDFIAVSAMVPTIMFVAHLPVTLLGNLGFFESVFVFYFLQIDIPAAGSLAMGLLLRVKMLTLGIVGYLVYLSYKYQRGTELEQLEVYARSKEESSG